MNDEAWQESPAVHQISVDPLLSSDAQLPGMTAVTPEESEGVNQSQRTWFSTRYVRRWDLLLFILCASPYPTV